MSNLGSVTIIKRGVVGNQKSVIFDIVPSTSVASGGDTITAGQIAQLFQGDATAMSASSFCDCQQDTSGNYAVLDSANTKFKFFVAAGTEATGNQSALTLRLRMLYGGTVG